MNRFDPGEALKIAEKFYAVPSGDCTWTDALATYAAAFPNVKFALAGYEGRLDNAEALAYANFDEHHIETYLGYYHSINPWAEIVLNAPFAPALAWGHDWVSDQHLKRSEFYNDWVRPQGDVATGFVSTLFRERDRFLVLSANVAYAKLIEGRKAADTFKIIGPHLRRSFELWRRLEGQSLAACATEEALNRLSSAVFVIDENHKVVFENDLARQMCREGWLVRTKPDGSFCFRSEANQMAVNRHLARIGGLKGSSEPLMIRLRSRKSKPIYLFISPIVREAGDGNLSPTQSILAPQMFVYFLIDPATEPRTKSDKLSKALGITHTEALLALALLQDKSLTEYADERKISRHTARVQLKSLLQKTECRRQAELVNLLAKTIGTFDIR